MFDVCRKGREEQDVEGGDREMIEDLQLHSSAVVAFQQSLDFPREGDGNAASFNKFLLYLSRSPRISAEEAFLLHRTSNIILRRNVSPRDCASLC
jgi:hypothetical protein